jgi:hypothetical protein
MNADVGRLRGQAWQVLNYDVAETNVGEIHKTASRRRQRNLARGIGNQSHREEMDMVEGKTRPVLLVGSVPLNSSASVFEMVGTRLGELVKRIPDGETGVRKNWIEWQADVMKRAKGLQPGGTRPVPGGGSLSAV